MDADLKKEIEITSKFSVKNLDETDLEHVFCCIRHYREQYLTDIADSLGYLKERLLKGWRTYAVLEGADKSVAMAIVVPGGDPFSSVTNQDFHYLHCLDVNKEVRKKGIGKKLVKRILKDLKSAKSKGLVVDCFGDYWMPDGFFAKLGFERIKSYPDHKVLAKKFTKDTKPDIIETAYRGDLPEQGIQVDIQYWTTCPVILNSYRKVPEMVKNIEPHAIIRERFINSREDRERWGNTGVFVNGKSVSPGPVKVEDLKRAIEAIKNK